MVDHFNILDKGLFFSGAPVIDQPFSSDLKAGAIAAQWHHLIRITHFYLTKGIVGRILIDLLPYFDKFAFVIY